MNFQEMLQSGDPALIEQVQKAIEINPALAGNLASTSPDSQKRENLSDTVSSLVATKDSIKFTNMLSLEHTKDFLYYFLRQTSLGNTSMIGAFSDQTTVNEFDPALFDRGSVVLKFSTDSKNISIATQSSFYGNSLGTDPMKVYEENALLSMLIRENISYMHASDSLDPYSISGVFHSHKKDVVTGVEMTPTAYAAQENVIDLRGAKINYEDINKADGRLNRLWEDSPFRCLMMPNVTIDGLTSTSVMSATAYDQMRDISKSYSKFIPNLISTHQNKIFLHNDIYMSKEKAFGYRYANDSNTPTITGAPEMPNVSAGTNAVVSDSGSSLFITADAGNYYYCVSAVNRFGASKLALISATPAAALAAYSVQLKFAAPSSGAAPTGYIIWRTKKDKTASDLFYPIMTLSAAQVTSGNYDGATGGAYTIMDRNRTIPGSEDAFLVASNQDGNKIDPKIMRRLELDPSKPFGGIKVIRTPQFVNVTSVKTSLLHAIGFVQPVPTKIIVIRNVGAV